MIGMEHSMLRKMIKMNILNEILEGIAIMAIVVLFFAEVPL